TAENSAAPATYSLDTIVRYRDSLDNSITTDTFSSPVQVVPQKSGGLLEIPAALTLIVVLLIGAGYYLLVMRKKR
ncbi:MAG: S-layer protein, partial [Methanoregula sp.]|nr:S-layer protein [Methanoregula sp.]